MKPLPASTIDTAARVFVVANTPYYLYKQLRKDGSVQQLAEELPTETIKRMLSLYATKWSKRREAAVAVYALLTALSFKPTSEFLDFLASFDAPAAAWVDHFRGIIMSKPEVGAAIRLTIPQPRLGRGDVISDASSQISSATGLIAKVPSGGGE
jgi:hypothetical protein